MASADHDWNQLSWWHWAAPLAAALIYAAKVAHIIPGDSALVLSVAVVLLGGAAFAAVHHAEVLAVRIGDPFGAILLALAITTLEVGLIISVMASGSPEVETIARDTVYSVVMIVLNGIVGLCLIAGAVRHFQQAFRVQGAVGILSVIITLAVVSLIMPNFTLATPGPTYSTKQLLFVGTITLFLYIVFVFVQTVRHRDDFVIARDDPHDVAKPRNKAVIISAVLMVVSLVMVILLAKTLSPVVELAILDAGLPKSVVGVVIGAVVLLPEAVTALKAARSNELQTSLNAALGSALASIGLTIPIIGAASVIFGQSITLGLPPEAMILLVLTLFISTLTFATGRTTVLQGAVHLVLFGVFIFLSAFP